MNKLFPLNYELRTYLFEHRSLEDPLLCELRSETRRVAGARASLQISADEGILLGMLVALSGARRVIEIGVFTGYSSTVMARHLPRDGRVLCCDINEEWTSVARRYWQRAGVAEKIDLRIGPAVETLGSLPEEEIFDFAFVDADKSNYVFYYEEILKRLQPNGLIAFDNMLARGRVVDPSIHSEQTEAVRRLNELLITDRRVEAVMLHVSDGVTLVRKLSGDEAVAQPNLSCG